MSRVWLVTGSAIGQDRSVAEAVLAAGNQLVARAHEESSGLGDALFWLHLGCVSVGGEPRAPNAAKHRRVQDASKRRDCH